MKFDVNQLKEKMTSLKDIKLSLPEKGFNEILSFSGNIKKTILTLIYISVLLSIGLYTYSNLYGIGQYSKTVSVTNELETLKEKTLEQKGNFEKDVSISSERGIISERDYVNYILEYSKKLNPKATMGTVEFKDKGKLSLTLKYLKYLDVENILRTVREGKTFLKLEKTKIEVKELEGYNNLGQKGEGVYLYYNLLLEGTLTQYEGITEEKTATDKLINTINN